MGSAAAIEEAGFEVVQAANADEAIANEDHVSTFVE